MDGCWETAYTKYYVRSHSNASPDEAGQFIGLGTSKDRLSLYQIIFGQIQTDGSVLFHWRDLRNSKKQKLGSGTVILERNGKDEFLINKLKSSGDKFEGDKIKRFTKQAFVIGVSGASASGKSTVVTAIGNHFTNSAVLGLDRFFKFFNYEGRPDPRDYPHYECTEALWMEDYWQSFYSKVNSQVCSLFIPEFI